LLPILQDLRSWSMRYVILLVLVVRMAHCCLKNTRQNLAIGYDMKYLLEYLNTRMNDC